MAPEDQQCPGRRLCIVICLFLALIFLENTKERPHARALKQSIECELSKSPNLTCRICNSSKALWGLETEANTSSIMFLSAKSGNTLFHSARISSPSCSKAKGHQASESFGDGNDGTRSRKLPNFELVAILHIVWKQRQECSPIMYGKGVKLWRRSIGTNINIGWCQNCKQGKRPNALNPDGKTFNCSTPYVFC